MSIFFDFDVGQSGRRFRRAVDGDKSDINAFINANSTVVFGDVDIGHLIELSVLSICMINEKKEVQGFVALGDHPNVPGVDPADWEHWLRNMFQRFYLSRNTLFLHYTCCKDSVADYFLDEALVTVFEHDEYLQQIVLMVPPQCPDDVLKCPAIKRRNLYRYYGKRFEDIEASHYLYTFLRTEFCPKLKMRRAVEEDNDDIVELLDKKCPRLKDLYGYYYVSEIIGRHPESDRKIIVAQHNDRAVGVMCLNSEINYSKLSTTYELRPFYGLRKATPLEKEEHKRANPLLKNFGEPIMDGKWSPFQRMVKKETVMMKDEPSKENINVTKSTKISKVAFGRNATMRKSLDHIYKHRHSDDFSDKVYVESPTHSQSAGYCITDLLEEDPFDYEIVNIDSELLTIPDALSCEFLPQGANFMRETKLMEIKKRRLSRGSICYKGHETETENIHYDGEPNAFMIELYGFHDEYHERHAFDLLEAAFEVMKIYDYCVIRVPCQAKPFTLLRHFCFVPTKPKVCSKYALYIAHRSCILGKFRVRPAEIMDIPQIASLLQNVEAQETLWTIENSIINKVQYYAYVLQNGLNIVGVGITEPPEQIDFIRAKLNLDLYHTHKYHFKGKGANAGFSTLKAVIVYPSFEVHYRFFAREIMRLSGSNSLIWLTAYRNKWVLHKANSIASYMIPLIPRKSEIDCTDIPQMKKIVALSNKITAFSTWYIGRNLTWVPKLHVNTRIMIIGASRTTMAFLDTLLFSDASTYLNFTNVTLVSPNGLPYNRQANTAAEMMFPKYRTSADRFLKSVPYTYYTNIVQGTMVEINKEDKYIMLSNGGKYYYDMLFLLLGKQYQHPNYLQELYERETEAKNAPYVPLDVPGMMDFEINIQNEYLPDNVFIVNNITEANRALKYVKNFFWQDFNYKVLVYGASITAYCCLSALLELGVPPENIVFIEPYPYENGKTRVPAFSNENVDQSVKEVLNSMKVTVYRSYYFQSWVADGYNTATHVDFLSYYKMIRLECSALFYYGKTGVSAQALNAIKKSGLVYDGGVLIDHEFRTKDPSIYAAGPVTRFYRRYYADTYRLKYYDSYEVGEKLGHQIRNQLDPLFSPKSKTRKSSVSFSMPNLSSDSSFSLPMTIQSSFSGWSTESAPRSDHSIERLPTLKKPIVTHCFLPGGLQYLQVRPPGKMIPHYYVQSKQYTSFLLETFKSGYFSVHFSNDHVVEGITCFSLDSDNKQYNNTYDSVPLTYSNRPVVDGFLLETFKSGYFSLHLSNDHVVDGITCLSPDNKHSLDNFKNLYGLSAIVLNNVYVRYSAKKIDDFYDYFRSPWAFYLYHDRCDELFAMAKEMLPKGQRKGKTLNDALHTIGRTLGSSSYRYNIRMRIRSRFEQSPHVEAIADYVIEWLSENDVVLPMYLQHEHRTELAHDLQTNPVFERKKKSLINMMLKIF